MRAAMICQSNVDLDFSSQRWQSFVVKRRTAPVVLSRRALEVCVFVHLADALQAGDFYVAGAENFGDTGPNSCRGPHASRVWRPIAALSECRRQARSSSPN